MSKGIIPGSSQAGKTILELVTIVTIVALIYSFALPSLVTIMNHSVLRSERHTLLQDIRTVRHAAIEKRRPAYLCAVDADGFCVRSANWNRGWIGFVDKNRNNTYDTADELLVSRAGPDRAFKVKIILHARWKDIKFDSRGVLRRSGHLRICIPGHDHEQDMKVIRMNAYGRLAIETSRLSCS